MRNSDCTRKYKTLKMAEWIFSSRIELFQKINLTKSFPILGGFASFDSILIHITMFSTTYSIALCTKLWYSTKRGTIIPSRDCVYYMHLLNEVEW